MRPFRPLSNVEVLNSWDRGLNLHTMSSRIAKKPVPRMDPWWIDRPMQPNIAADWIQEFQVPFEIRKVTPFCQPTDVAWDESAYLLGDIGVLECPLGSSRRGFRRLGTLFEELRGGIPHSKAMPCYAWGLRFLSGPNVLDPDWDEFASRHSDGTLQAIRRVFVGSRK